MSAVEVSRGQPVAAAAGGATYILVGLEFTMKRVLITGSLIAALAFMSVSSASTRCSIHPAKDATDAQLPKLAKISQADAEKRALARVKSPAKVVGSELQ